MGKTLVVTGWNGFVGGAFLELLSRHPFLNDFTDITLVSRTNTGMASENLPKKKVTFVQADLTKRWEFSARPGSILVNLAADGSRAPYGKDACESFALITRNGAAWVASNKPSKVFHASSGAVDRSGYQNLDGTPYSQITKKLFIDSRLEAEFVLNVACSRISIPLIVGRLYTFFGQRILSRNYLISELLSQALSVKKTILLRANPRTKRSFLGQNDLARWIISSLSKIETNTILSIGSTSALTVDELANLIASVSQKTVLYSSDLLTGDLYYPRGEETKVMLDEKETESLEEFVCKTLRKG